MKKSLYLLSPVTISSSFFIAHKIAQLLSIKINRLALKFTFLKTLQKSATETTTTATATMVAGLTLVPASPSRCVDVYKVH